MKVRTMLAAGFAGAAMALMLGAIALPPLAALGWAQLSATTGASSSAVDEVGAPAAEGRMLFDPGPSAPFVAKVRPDGSTVPGNPWAFLDPDFVGPGVQNLGAAPTRVLVLDGTPIGSDAPSCDRCVITRTMCSPVISPGATWRVSSAVAIVSLSVQPVDEAGAEWAQAAESLALGADATVADVVCKRAAALSESPGSIGCLGTAVLEAYAAGGQSDIVPGVDMATARGEPIGGVILHPSRLPGEPERWTTDRFEALGLDDIGRASPRADGPMADVFVYDLPGAWIQSPDGLRSNLHLLNPNDDCATVVVAAYRTGNGFRGAFTVTLGAGGLTSIDLDASDAIKGVSGSAAIRVESNRPLAAALTVLGTNVSYTVPAIRMPAAALVAPTLRLLMPLGYQEKVNFAVGEALSGGHGGEVIRLDATEGAPVGRLDALSPDQAPLDRAQGWETNISVFNPYLERLKLAFRFQAAGEPRREFAYPLVPRVQTVFQPGFGLGRPGGVGWGEMAVQTLPLPVSIAVHSWREAQDTPVVIEGWGVRTWPFDSTAPPPRFIGLPDLGGPALASPDVVGAAPIVSLTGTMTDTFGGRIAVQNPLTRTARIAIDTYAPLCGYAGTVEQRIDPRQHVLVNVRDLPGVANGANSAVVRVIDGAVAAMVEFRRPEWSTLADSPEDVASAYLGTPVDAATAGPMPEPLTARLAVTPTALSADRGALTPLMVLVGHVPDDARCARYTATADVPWLTVSNATGMIPDVLTLTIDARWLPSGTATGVVTVSSADATIEGSPQRITVTVTGEAVQKDPGLAYVPYAVRWVGR